MPGRIKVSSLAFDEIAAALTRQGQKINEQGSCVIEKDMTIEQPYDFRLATIRKDCLVEAVKHLHNNGGANVVDLANQMFEFVLNGAKANG